MWIDGACSISFEIPHFDSIMLHHEVLCDSPVDGKSSCQGNRNARGTCIAGSIVETSDNIGCVAWVFISSHLHGIFYLRLNTKSTVCKAMGMEGIDGRTKPTWKLIEGICWESLTFETTQREGIPETVIKRAEELYLSLNRKDASLGETAIKDDHPKFLTNFNCSVEIYDPSSLKFSGDSSTESCQHSHQDQ